MFFGLPGTNSKGWLVRSFDQFGIVLMKIKSKSEMNSEFKGQVEATLTSINFVDSLWFQYMVPQIIDDLIPTTKIRKSYHKQCPTGTRITRTHRITRDLMLIPILTMIFYLWNCLLVDECDCIFHTEYYGQIFNSSSQPSTVPGWAALFFLIRFCRPDLHF